MSYLCDDVAMWIDTFTQLGMPLDMAMDVYMRTKINDLRKNPVALSACYTYKEWVDEHFVTQAPIDDDYVPTEVFPDEPPVSEVLPEYPKAGADIALVDIVTDQLYSSPIFPLTEVKCRVLASRDINQLSRLADAVTAVTVAQCVEQGGISVGGFQEAISSRIRRSLGWVGKVVESVNNMASATALLNKIFERILSSFDFIAQTVSLFSDFLKGMKEKLMEMCLKTWEKLAEWGEHFYYVIPMFCSIFLIATTCFLINKFLSVVAPRYCFSSSSIIQLIVVGCAIVGCKEMGAALLALSSAGKKSFLDLIYETFGVDTSEFSDTLPKDENAVPSPADWSQFENCPAYEQSSTSMTGFFGILGLLTFFAPRGMKCDLYEMTKWAHGLKGLADGYEKFKSITEKLAFWVYERIGLDTTWDAPAIQSMILVTGIRFQDWCSEVEKLSIDMLNYTNLQEDLTRARKLKEQGDKIQTHMMYSTESISFMMREKLRASLTTIASVIAKFEKAVDISGTRMCPFTVLFHGPAGSGKSNSMRGFMHDVMNEMGEPSVGRIYPRNSGDKHWSGYLRQTALYYDEFAQKKPTNGESDELELIPLVSCSHFPLFGAAIEDKGLSFNSKYVFMCSNRADVSPNAGLADNDAFRRRRHLCVEVTRDAREFDPSNPTYNQTFQLKNPLKPTENLKFSRDGGAPEEVGPMSYNELVIYAVNRAQEHFDRETKAMKYAVSRATNTGRAHEQAIYYCPRFTCERMKLDTHACPHLANEHFQGHEVYGEFRGDYFCCDKNGTACDCPLTNWEKSIMHDMSANATDDEIALALALFSQEENRLMSDYAGFFELIDDMDNWRLDTPPRAKKADLQAYVNRTWADYNDRLRFLMCQHFDRTKSARNSYFQRLKTLKDDIRSWSVVGAWNTLPMGAKWLVGIIALFSFGASLIWLLSKVMAMHTWNPMEMLGVFLGSRSFIEVATEQGGYAESGSNTQAPIYRHKRVRAYEQGASDSQVMDLNDSEKIEAIKKAQGILVFSKNDGKSAAAAVTIFKDHQFLITTHELALLNFSKGCILTMRSGASYAIYIDAGNVVVGSKGGIKDPISVVKVSTYFGMAKACTGSIMFDFGTYCEGHHNGIVIPNAHKSLDQSVLKSTFSRRHEVIDIHNDKGRVVWQANNLMTVPIYHQVGHCGRLLLARDEAKCLKIVGVHVAGIVIQEKYISLFSEINAIHKSAEVAVQQGMDIDILELVEPETKTEMVVKIGQVAHGQQFRPASRTAIIKSQIHDTLWRAPETEPTVISPTDPRVPYQFDPYTAGIMKFEKEVGPLDFTDPDSHESTVVQDITEELAREKKAIGGFALDTVCSDDVAINGVEGVPYAERLVMSTSEGYPFVLSRKAQDTGKFRFFDKDGDKWIAKDEVLDDLHELEESIKSEDFSGGIITIACAKDEKTKIKKVREVPKTRIFEILPFHYNILVRKYYLFFMQFIMSLHDFLPCKVGLNVYSKSWDTMHAEHNRFAYHFNGDYTGFDTATPRVLMMRIADMVSELACDGRENAIVRRNLMRMAVERRILVLRDLYQVKGGTPSGFALTVIINSVVNQFYLMWAWRKIMSRIDPGLVPYRVMRSHCTFSVYGDDNVVSFSLQVKDMYNLVTIASELKVIGVNLSDGKKTGNLVKWMDFSDLDFLKRRWVLSSGQGFLCPLDKSAIEERLFWVRTSEDSVETLDDNCYSALMEAFHHGREYFQFLRTKIQDAYDKAGLFQPHLLHFNEAQAIWLEQHSVEPINDYLDGIKKEVLPLTAGRDVLRVITPTIDAVSVKGYNRVHRELAYRRTKVFLDPKAKEIMWLRSDQAAHLNIPASLNKRNFEGIARDVAKLLRGEKCCIVEGTCGINSFALALAIGFLRKELTSVGCVNLLASYSSSDASYYTGLGMLTAVLG
uniref:RNA1 polyprotein n=1 Tax=Strawberry mottle virus TaxID=167161 RepID=A0A142I1A5_9SECO|nr:polyprotein [Strawberry mottle virus]